VPRSQRQLILGLVALIAVIAAAYALLRSGQKPVGISTEFSEYGVCLACKYEGQVDYPREQPAPHRCPKCGQQAFYPLYFCFDCKRRFVPALERNDPAQPARVPLIIACPNCTSSRVSPFLGGQAGYEPEGPDVPLPHWP